MSVRNICVRDVPLPVSGRLEDSHFKKTVAKRIALKRSVVFVCKGLFGASWKDMLALSRNTFLEMPMNHILDNQKKGT